jgi:L-threonylcarbamoyladenylate synthase
MDAAIARAVAAIRSGGVIAYPTEAVWGIGCDSQNESAVRRIFALKRRPEGVGVILIAADVRQLEPYIGDCSQAALERARASWPGPNTWIFPRSAAAPSWVVGNHAGIAVRVTAHPVARAMCQAHGAAIVSTSANTHGQAPARNVESLQQMFGQQLDEIVEGELGGLERPTAIRDAVSGEIVRH